jgi:hypothetical protein
MKDMTVGSVLESKLGLVSGEVLNQVQTDDVTITATIVPQDQRPGFLGRYLGGAAFIGEMMLFQFMDRLCPSYKGGMWEFIELSNGAMFPKMSQEKVDCAWPDNFSEAKVTPQAAGIVVTLFTLSHLSFRLKGDALEKVCALYENLREYMYGHPEARSIIALTD